MTSGQRRRRAARLLGAGVLGGAFALTQLAGAAAVPANSSFLVGAAPAAVPHKCPDPDRVGPPAVVYEGLPDRDIPCTYNYVLDQQGRDPTNYATWTGLRQAGNGQVTKARQAFGVPNLLLAAVAPVEVVPPPAGVANRLITHVRAFVISPNGSEHRYGDFADFQVRTLAFGTVPAEVTVRLTQPRPTGNYPQGIAVDVASNFIVSPSHNEFDAVTGSGRLQVEVTRVVIDGQNVDIGSECRTQTPAELDILAADNPAHDSRTFDASKQYEPFKGGTIRGRLDVPRFTGCVGRSGDDLSRLFTGLVSGPDNPVLLKLSNINSNCFPSPSNEKCPATPPVPALPTKDNPNL